MTDRVDPTMHRVEPAPPQRHFDRPASHAERHELPPGHNTVLLFGKCHKSPIERVQAPFAVYATVNGGSADHALNDGLAKRTRGAQRIAS